MRVQLCVGGFVVNSHDSDRPLYGSRTIQWPAGSYL